jgi:histidinol-phosphatase (PHP family)
MAVRLSEEEQAHFSKDPDSLYEAYFQLVEKAARSGLFHIMGHLDLIKIFGIRPRTDVRKLAEKVLDAVQEFNLAVEINTNGRYKPVGEWYPEQKLIEEIIRRNIPISLGSDAHAPENVGRDIADVCSMLKGYGLKKVASFNKGEKVFVNV